MTRNRWKYSNQLLSSAMAEGGGSAAKARQTARAKSDAVVRFARQCKVITDPILVYAGLQTALDKVSTEHQGLLRTAVGLLDASLAACGVCKTLLFVGSGYGHVEYALHTVFKAIIAANPRKYPYVDMKAVITDGVVGPFAPPKDELPPWVRVMSAEEAIRANGGPETLVVQIKADSGGGAPTGAAKAAANAGCAGFLWWGEVPTEGIDETALNTAVESASVAGEQLTQEEQLRVKLWVLQEDGRPRSDGHPADWSALNSLYTRFYKGPEHAVGFGGWKMAAWICFVLKEKPLPFEKPVRTVPLPRLEGERLKRLVERYATLLVVNRTK